MNKNSSEENEDDFLEEEIDFFLEEDSDDDSTVIGNFQEDDDDYFLEEEIDEIFDQVRIKLKEKYKENIDFEEQEDRFVIKKRDPEYLYENKFELLFDGNDLIVASHKDNVDSNLSELGKTIQEIDEIISGIN